MTAAYVDTSCLVAVAFDEPSGKTMARQLVAFDRLVASNLLEAELQSAISRESAGLDTAPLLDMLSWFYPNRRLTPEFQRITRLDYVRGADLWHLACALALSPNGAPLSFLTLDRRQRLVAAKLGFVT